MSSSGPVGPSGAPGLNAGDRAKVLDEKTGQSLSVKFVRCLRVRGVEDSVSVFKKKDGRLILGQFRGRQFVRYGNWIFEEHHDIEILVNGIYI